MNALFAFVFSVLLMLSPDQLNWIKEDWRRIPEHLLGFTQWSGQQDVMSALQTHRKVAVPSGHKVGKTNLVGSLCCGLTSLYPNARIITTASTSSQVVENVWGEIRNQKRHALYDLGGDLKPSAPLWQFGDLHYCKGISTDNPESFNGKHSEDGIVVVIMDECQSIQREIWTSAMTMTSDDNGYLLVIANPTIPSGPFFDAVTTDPTFKTVRLSVLDHPNIVQGRKVMPGPSQGLVDTFLGTAEEGPRLTGHFNTNVGDCVILLGNIQKSADVNDDQLNNSDGIHIGVDIADRGGDKCVAVITENRAVIDVEEWVYPGQDGLMMTTGRILDLKDRWGLQSMPHHIHVDGIGVGAGVVSRLFEQGHRVDNVVAGGGAEGDWDWMLGDDYRFKNRKAELWWVARTLFEISETRVPAQYRQIVADLAAPGWSFASDKDVVIEKKEKVIKRIGRSPDHGDAYILSLSRIGNMGGGIRYV